jgi:hypothetical protein
MNENVSIGVFPTTQIKKQNFLAKCTGGHASRMNDLKISHGVFPNLSCYAQSHFRGISESILSTWRRGGAGGPCHTPKLDGWSAVMLGNIQAKCGTGVQERAPYTKRQLESASHNVHVKCDEMQFLYVSPCPHAQLCDKSAGVHTG